MLSIFATSDLDLYEQVSGRGRWAERWASMRGQSSRLLHLAALSSSWTIRDRHFAGRQTVPIQQIRGSESRNDDFDAAFRPRRMRTAGRWTSIAQAWLAGFDLPPVELIRVGEAYFVRDGHHRISVAAAMGAQEIEAVVTVWEVDGPLPWEQPVGQPLRAASRKLCARIPGRMLAAPPCDTCNTPAMP